MSPKPDPALIDSDYDSAEDSDFDPSSAPAAVDDDFSGDSTSEAEDATTKSKPKKRKRTLSTTSETTSGGLIKTRSQRALETRSKAGGVSSGAVTTDVDALWAAMNSSAPQSKPETPETSLPSETAAAAVHSETGEKMVSITHTYEFAGKTITEEKLVPASSETARVHLSSSASPAPTTSENGKPARRPPPKKRASAFDSAAASRNKAAQPAKINTLEKSRLDWAGFVDKEGIGDDLKKWNKGDKGYLDRQAFLGRVDENRDRQWKEANKKG
jgi:hypothetical protein